MIRAKHSMHRVSGLLLVVALLLGQLTLLEHEYDFAAHKAGDTCVTCLHATSLGHALSAAAGMTLPFVVGHAEFSHDGSTLTTFTPHAYRARAPPHAFSII